MKRILLLIFIASSAQLISAQIGPELTLEYTTHDRGIISHMGNGLFKFPYTNTGDKPLIITVKSSCGCLVPSYRNTPLPPGETDTIYGKYATTRLGLINKSLTVQSNDTENPTIVLRIKGVVLEDSLHFGFTELNDKKYTNYFYRSGINLGSLTSDSVAFQVQNFNPHRSFLDFSELKSFTILVKTNEEFSPIEKLFLEPDEQAILMFVKNKDILIEGYGRVEEVIKIPSRELKLSAYMK